MRLSWNSLARESVKSVRSAASHKLELCLSKAREIDGTRATSAARETATNWGFQDIMSLNKEERDRPSRLRKVIIRYGG